MESDITLTTPPLAGKSTLAKLLAAEVPVPRCSLDDLRSRVFLALGSSKKKVVEDVQRSHFSTAIV